MMVRLLASLFFLIVTSAGAFAQNLPLFSVWKNDGGSVLTVSQVSKHKFRGTFTSYAPGYGCQGIPYPAVGSVSRNGDFSLRVRFAKCASVTTWHGRLRGNQIVTRWKLVYVDLKGRTKRMSGPNFFTRQ
jgi:Avidin family